MKKLIVMSAVPGSGKSTWAKKYASEHSKVVIVSSDDIRYELTGQYQDFSKQHLVWKILGERLHELAETTEDITVILDAVIDLNSLRIKYVEEYPEYDKYILVVISKPLSMIKETNLRRRREKWVPEEVLLMLYNKFEQPSKEVIDLYSNCIYIDKYF